MCSVVFAAEPISLKGEKPILREATEKLYNRRVARVRRVSFCDAGVSETGVTNVWMLTVALVNVTVFFLCLGGKKAESTDNLRRRKREEDKDKPKLCW
jgi:hypothetical protein